MKKMIISGRLAAAAEKKLMKSGQEFLDFRIANNEYWDEKDSEGKYTKTCWVHVTSFNPLHLRLATYLQKGKLVQVIGNYSDKVYQSKLGTCEISREIVVDSIEFIETSSNNQTNPNGTTTATPTPTATPTKTMPTVTSAPVPPTVSAPINADAGGDDVDDLPF